jgi:predicted DNA-binding transcriptional regulator AlpA
MYQDNLSRTAPSGLQGDGPSRGGSPALQPLRTHSMRDGRDNSCEERYISRRELRQLFPVSDMTIWRWQHDPHVAFPVPVKLGNNGRNFWWLPAIRDWERRRLDASASSRREAS